MPFYIYQTFHKSQKMFEPVPGHGTDAVWHEELKGISLLTRCPFFLNRYPTLCFPEGSKMKLSIRIPWP
jgi:hypothetical protein